MNQPSFRIEKQDSWAVVKTAFDAIPFRPGPP